MSHAVMHDVTEMADARERLADLVHTQQSRLDDAGKRLRVEAARLRCIFESVSDAILAVDDRRTVVLANAAADSMFGCTGGALVGLSLDRMLCDCDLLWQRARAAEPGAGFGHEMHGRRTDGSVFPLSAAMARAEVDGQFLFTAVFRDLTEYVCAERSLHAGRALLDAALASMQDAVVIADSDGRLVEFNDAFVSFHRFGNRSDCMTRLVDYPLLFEVSDADGRPVPQEAWPLRRALRGEVASQIEYRVRRIDTNAQWVGSYSFSPVRGAGGASGGAVLSMRDVTLWHGTQAELHTSQRLLRQLLKVQDDVAQEERKRIARDIHDDLLQQLAAIRLEVGIWEQSSDPQDCVCTVDRMVSQTIAATRRIVNDLRPQALEEFGLVAAMQALTGSFARRSSVQVELDVDPGVEPLLAAAPAISTCIFRVAQEALHNVEKHAIARQVSVRLSSLEQGRVGLSVMDDGQGMDARGVHRSDAFGLLGIHERVRSLGGDLHIRSRSGAGFCLTIDLPARDVAPVAWSEPGNPIRPVAIVTIDRAG